MRTNEVKPQPGKRYCADVIQFGVTWFQCDGGHAHFENVIHTALRTSDDGTRVAMTWQRSGGLVVADAEITAK